MNKRAKMGCDAVRNGVFGRLSLPKDRRVTYLTKEEIEAFFQAIPKESIRDRLLFDLIYRHGLRKTEAALLRMEGMKGGRIWIGRVKGGVSGEYPLHPDTQKLLDSYLYEEKNPENPYLINTRQSGNDNPMAPSTIFASFRRYAIKAGIPREKEYVHILRHSIAVHLMNAGWDLADVQDWLGHKSISSTTIYAKITNKRREVNHERTLNSAEIARTFW